MSRAHQTPIIALSPGLGLGRNIENGLARALDGELLILEHRPETCTVYVGVLQASEENAIAFALIGVVHLAIRILIWVFVAARSAVLVARYEGPFFRRGVYSLETFGVESEEENGNTG
jgi:hypothetical protein